jgi:hypothetical protein
MHNEDDGDGEEMENGKDGDTRQRDLLMPEVRLRTNSRITVTIYTKIPVLPRRLWWFASIQIQKYVRTWYVRFCQSAS